MNRPMTKLLVAMTLALGGLAAPAFAGETIAISYHQVGICKGYDTAAGPVTTRSDEAFAIFKIEAADNTKPQRKFRFRPNPSLCGSIHSCTKGHEGCVGSKNRRFVYSDPRFAQNMGVSSAVEATIPAGIKLEINSFAVVPLGINNPGGGLEANQYSFDLVYDTWSTDEHENNGPGGGLFFIVVMVESLFGGPKELGSKTIDLIKTNPSETTWSVTDNCKALSFK